VLFFVLPFGVMAMMSFYSGNPVTNPNAFLTTRHYERFIFDTAGIFHDALWATLRIGLITTVVSLLIGYPLAHWMARMQSRLGHALVLIAVIAPMLTGIVVPAWGNARPSGIRTETRDPLISPTATTKSTSAASSPPASDFTRAVSGSFQRLSARFVSSIPWTRTSSFTFIPTGIGRAGRLVEGTADRRRLYPGSQRPPGGLR